MAYSVSRPTRRWKTSGLLATVLFTTVRHYRIAKIGFRLALRVGSNAGQRRRQGPRVKRLANRLQEGRGGGSGGRVGGILVHIRGIRTRGGREQPAVGRHISIHRSPAAQ